MSWAIDETDMSKQVHLCAATRNFAWRVIFLVRRVRLVALRTRAFFPFALVDLCIGVTEFDGNVSDEFVLESDGLDTRDGFDDGGFSVSYVSDGADVDGGLFGNDFGREWVEVVMVDADGGEVLGDLGDVPG